VAEPDVGFGVGDRRHHRGHRAIRAGRWSTIPLKLVRHPVEDRPRFVEACLDPHLTRRAASTPTTAQPPPSFPSRPNPTSSAGLVREAGHTDERVVVGQRPATALSRRRVTHYYPLVGPPPIDHLRVQVAVGPPAATDRPGQQPPDSLHPTPARSGCRRASSYRRTGSSRRANCHGSVPTVCHALLPVGRSTARRPPPGWVARCARQPCASPARLTRIRSLPPHHGRRELSWQLPGDGRRVNRVPTTGGSPEVGCWRSVLGVVVAREALPPVVRDGRGRMGLLFPPDGNVQYAVDQAAVSAHPVTRDRC
jgi:hypothetical protein